MTEKEIQNYVAQAQQGDNDSAGALFDHFYPRIYRFLALRLNTREIAEDLAQTVFLEMIKSIKKYQLRDNAKFSTWLFQIARFRLIDYYRGHKNIVSVEGISESEHPNLVVDPAIIYLDNRSEIVWKKLSNLSEKYQTVIYLYYSEGMSISEIAESMKISSINARVLKSRALKKLIQQLN